MPMTVSSWMRIVPDVEYSVVRISTTPVQMSSPASVTTNDGTPALVMTSACSRPMAVVIGSATADGRPPRPVRRVRPQQQRHR